MLKAVINFEYHVLVEYGWIYLEQLILMFSKNKYVFHSLFSKEKIPNI